MIYTILYLEINLMAVILIGVIMIKSAGITRMVAQRTFTMTIIAEMIFFLSDAVAVAISQGFFPLGAAFLIVAKEIYFFSTTLMCFYWFVYFEYLQDSPFVQNRKRVWLSSVLVWITVILLVVNLFTGILFYVDEQGGYHRGTLFIILYVLAYIYVFFSCFCAAIGLFQKSKRSKRKTLIMLVLFPIAPAGAGILQYIYPQIPVACVALSIATLILYLHWMDDMVSLDPLTKLNNRKQLVYHFDHLQKGSEGETAYLFLIDANRFKSINDTYGHLQGDEALIRIADALREACRGIARRPNIARYGGDEFVVLAILADPEIFQETIHQKLTEINAAKPVPYELSVSVGFVAVEEGTSLSEAIEQADEKMYQQKKNINASR